jgi:AmmeMemoRadiSam system protein B
LFQGVTKKDILKGKKIVGLIAPHAGFFASGHCAAWAYRQLKDLGHIRRVILLGVSHRGNFYGACVSDFSHNATPLGKIAVDRNIVKKLAGEKNFRINNRIMQHEHSLENQLPFLQRVLANESFKIVPILFGYLNKQDFSYMAGIIAKYIDDRTLIVASSDFTHFGASFGYLPFAEKIKDNITKLDMGMIKSIMRLDFDGYFKYQKKTGITMCGFFPVGVLLKIFSNDRNRGYLVNYYKSGDLSGDYQKSVSYAAIVFTERLKANSKTGSVAGEKKVSLNLTEG